MLSYIISMHSHGHFLHNGIRLRPQMITDVRNLPDGAAVEADICIVGAGAAGITLAMELLGHGFRVALLESGGLDFEDDIQSLNDGDCVSEQKVDLTWSRLRYFGGTTGHWGGNCAPLGCS